MKYISDNEHIPQDRRRELNDKILYLIDSGQADSFGITKQDIYNGYTGDGGLHCVKRSDYENYSEYSKAKKEIENGQFFTPPKVCEFVAHCLNISKGDLVADLTCGMGNFFNFMPTENNLYGCEIDNKAYKVARHLYPDANIKNQDIRLYQPGILFDYVVGNPPFHLRWWTEDKKEIVSQLYYCIKAHELLKPYGILAVIVPSSFLADTFTDSGIIKEMEDRFSFLGQVELPDNTFSAMGVSHFRTKLQFWQKKNNTEDISFRYCTECPNRLPSKFTDNISKAKKALTDNRMDILKQAAANNAVSANFRYEVENKQTILIGFIGLENDVEVCVNIFKYAVEVVLAEIKRIMKEDPCHSENAGVSYGYGFCAGLHKAFKKQQEENQNEWGLVLVLPKAVAEATGHLTKKPFNARSQENITPDNYMKGYIEGEKFSINRLAERKQA